MGKQFDSGWLSEHTEVASGVKFEVTKGRGNGYARVEAVNGEGDRNSRVDASEFEPHIKLVIIRVHGKIGPNGAIEGKQIPLLLYSSRGLTSVSEDLMQELQRKASGQVEVTRPFEGKTRVLTAFDEECIANDQTAPLDLTIDTVCETVRMALLFVVLPGELNSVNLVPKPLREVLFTDMMVDSTRMTMALSGDGTRSGLDRENLGTKEDLTSGGVGTTGNRVWMYLES